MKRNLEKLRIQNFKSIRDQELALGQLNIFIGGNGSGKSNLIQGFRLLRELAEGNLAAFSLERGADNLLHFGRKSSPFMAFYLRFAGKNARSGYEVLLSPTDEGSLIIGNETLFFDDHARDEVINRGSKESALQTMKNSTAGSIGQDLATCRVYHFHDTSESAKIKEAGPVDDNRALRGDGSNLAAYLYFLQQTHSSHFYAIEETVRQIAPFFDRFTLAPSRLAPEKIRLEWKEAGSDTYFSAASLSDGTLRFMCLATLLLQPVLPAIILLDEPELGLHPAAITLLAQLISSVATESQVLMATQSATLVNQFDPETVWTVERGDRQSVFKRLSKDDLAAWLAEYEGHEGYGLGELWEKNLLGGRP